MCFMCLLSCSGEADLFLSVCLSIALPVFSLFVLLSEQERQHRPEEERGEEGGGGRGRR